MTTETVSKTFEQGGSIASTRPGDGPLGGTANSKHIHPVHLFADHAESFGFTPNFRIAGGTVVVHTNTPTVILNHEKDRQFPQSRHIQALKKLTYVASAITEECRRHRITISLAQGVTAVATGKSGPHCYGNALTNESVTA